MIDYSDFTLKFDTKGIEGLYEWIEENYTCTKRGKSPHPYADVLHEWVENTNCDLEWFDGEYWRQLYNLPIKEVVTTEYRIKQSEPVYEWQWEFTYNGLICRTGFYTYEQIKAYMYNIKVTKIEETKRERK